MPTKHKIVRDDGARADVGTEEFTMRSGEMLPGVPGLAGTPCWYCQQPIGDAQKYYVISVWSSASVISNSALIHAEHAE